jgi:hypothetical protein
VKRHLYARGAARVVQVARDAVPPADIALANDFASRRVLPSSSLLGTLARLSHIALTPSCHVAPIYDVMDEGMNSLFVYTGIGGVAWGAAVAIWQRAPRRQIVSHALRTGSVSTFIPLYFVGILLNSYVCK